MERFFISNAELSSLIICAVLGKRGRRSGLTSYIVDCGTPLRIVDVVRRIAGHVGKRIVEEDPGEKELVIKLVGVRAGEKLTEQMHQSSDLDNTDMEKLKIGWDDGFVSTLRDLPKEFRFLHGSSSLCVDDLVSRFCRLLDVDS